MNYSEYNMQCQRRAILDILAQNPQATLNTNIVFNSLTRVGYGCSESQFKTLLSWLDSNGFVHITTHHDIRLVKITSSGKDVAGGYMVHPDICNHMPS